MRSLAEGKTRAVTTLLMKPRSVRLQAKPMPAPNRSYELKAYAALAPQQQEKVRSLILAKRSGAFCSASITGLGHHLSREDLTDAAVVVDGVRNSS
ncbi:MAG: hypothetical protein QW587_07760 [Candidatus Bathyarchaeia archaeon]